MIAIFEGFFSAFFSALATWLMLTMTGIYFIFSNTVMKALAGQKQGAQTMIAINRVILNPWFYLLFFGSAVAALFWLLTGHLISQIAAVVFLLGTTAVTAFKNVPLNNQLLAAENNPHILWQTYQKQWGWWNLVRTWSAAVSGGLLLLGQ